MVDLLDRLWREIAVRPEGPLAFRFYIQPCMATFLAIRDGLKDARSGREAYLWSAFFSPGHRKEILADGWKSAGKIVLIAAGLDVIYQLIVLHGLRPVQTVFIAVVLAVIPYITFRGPVNRIATMIRHHSPHQHLR
jgi:hypothetical protein